MGKHRVITVHVDPKVRNTASRVLHQVGLGVSDAVALFLKQVALHGGLPFDVGTPSAKLRRPRERVPPAYPPQPRTRSRDEDPLKPEMDAWESKLRELRGDADAAARK